jgi:hypothetical protein
MSGNLTYTVVADSTGEEEKKPTDWDFAGGRYQRLTGEEPNDIEVVRADPEPEGGTEVEIEPAPRRSRSSDPDIDVEELQRTVETEKAQREAAEQRARDIEASWQLQQHKATLQSSYVEEEQKYVAAQKRLSEAHSNYEPDAAAAATAEMVVAAQRMERFAEAYNILDAQPQPAPQQPPQQQQQGDAFEAALANVHPNVAQWARANRADITREDRWRLALAADAMAQAKGMPPGSDEYLDFMDESMGYLEPEPSPQPVRQAKRQQGGQKRMYAAPSSRSNSRSPGSKVFLTDDHRRQARDLNMSDQEFSRYVADANKGQMTREQTGGRLRASYDVNTVSGYKDYR